MTKAVILIRVSTRHRKLEQQMQEVVRDVELLVQYFSLISRTFSKNFKNSRYYYKILCKIFGGIINSC